MIGSKSKQVSAALLRKCLWNLVWSVDFFVLFLLLLHLPQFRLPFDKRTDIKCLIWDEASSILLFLPAFSFSLSRFEIFLPSLLHHLLRRASACHIPTYYISVCTHVYFSCFLLLMYLCMYTTDMDCITWSDSVVDCWCCGWMIVDFELSVA